MKGKSEMTKIGIAAHLRNMHCKEKKCSLITKQTKPLSFDVPGGGLTIIESI